MSEKNENKLKNLNKPLKKSTSVKVDASRFNLHDTDRPILTEKDLREQYSFDKLESNDALKSTINYCSKYYKPNKDCLFSYLLERVPFLKWITQYDPKENLLKDVIAGLTIGIVHIPQGMAYSLMAGLPAVYGLYVSFFPVLIYVFLGTSRHLSIGSFAITSLMTFSCIERLEGKYYPSVAVSDDLNSNSSWFNTTQKTQYQSSPDFLSNDPTEAKILISMCITLMTGVIQILFAIFHVGFVTKFLSDVIVTGFTTGAAIHIILSQVNPLLGITTGKVTMPFKLIGNLIEIFKNIHRINFPTAIVGLVSIILFVLVRELINERYKHKMIMPIPIELILVIFGTLFAYLFDFEHKWKIKIVGDLPRGIPAPSLPPLWIIPDIISESISIAIVSFALNISMAKLFSKKYKYDLMPNQEAFAYGMGNLITALFKGFPACVALSRSAILDGVGGKTQVYGLVSSVLMLIVCLALGPFFKTLPNACLAAIIVVALKNMLLQITQFPDICKRSKFEALAWGATFLGVLTFDVDIGLYIGVSFTLMLVIFRSQRPRMAVLGNIPFTDIYESIEICREAEELPEIKILRFEESIYYANVDNFKYKVLKYSQIDVNEVLKKIHKEKSEYAHVLSEQEIIKTKVQLLMESKGVDNLAYENQEELDKNIEKIRQSVEEHLYQIQQSLPVKHIILDCSSINNIDTQGVNAFLQLFELYQDIGVQLHLTFCKPILLKMFKKAKFEDRFDYEYIYPTTHDAVLHISHRKTSRNPSPAVNKKENTNEENNQSIENSSSIIDNHTSKAHLIIENEIKLEHSYERL